MSPDSETTPNTVVLVSHGNAGDLRRLEEMKISKCFAALPEGQGGNARFASRGIQRNSLPISFHHHLTLIC